MVPVLLITSANSAPYAVQDSKAIMEYFESRFQDSISLHPESPNLRFSAMLLEMLADEWLVIYAMYWRWAPENVEKQRSWLDYEFGYSATGGKETFEKTVEVGRKGTTRFSSFCPGLGITTKSSPVLRRQFMHLLSLLSAHFNRGHRFLLGNRISAADFAFYGPLYAHGVRDPVPGFLIKTEAPLVAAWIERIGLAKHEKGAWPTSGSTQDNIPDTLVPISQMLMQDYILIFGNTVRDVLELLHNHSQVVDVVTVPRHMKPRTFRLHLDGKVVAEEKRTIATHCTWMMQRILDQAFSSSNRGACMSPLNQLAGGDTTISGQWKECIQLLNDSGWHIERDSKNQLVARRMAASRTKL